MKIRIKQISELEYSQLVAPVLFENRILDKAFAIVYDNEQLFKVAWQSDLMRPIIRWATSNILAIGIDLSFAIVDWSEGLVLKKYSLNYFFCDIKIYLNIIYVITELEIIEINISDLVIIGEIALPSYYEKFEANSKEIVITCINEEIVRIMQPFTPFNH